MNKQQLIDTLSAEFYKVGAPKLQLSEAGLNIYAIKIFELNGSNLTWRNIEFVVEDEELVSEAAYWLPDQPGTKLMSNKFFDDVKSYIKGKVDDGTFAAVFVIEEDLNNDKAVAWAYSQAVDVWSETKILLWRDNVGKITHAILDTVVRVGS